MQVEDIKEVLQAWKNGKALQVRGVSSSWEDGNGLNLSTLMNWMSLGKSVRVVPPEPLSTWVGVFVNPDGGLYVSSLTYSNKKTCEAHGQAFGNFKYAAEFIEKTAT